MFLLDRYIWRQIIWPSLLALIALNLLFLMMQLLRIGNEALGMGIGFLDTAKLSVLILPSLAGFIVPVAVFIGTTMAFGRMTEEGETTAWFSTGVVPLRLLRAPAILGLGAALLTAVFSLWIGPCASGYLRQQAILLARKNMNNTLHQGRFFEEIPGMVLLPGRPDESGGWRGFLVYDRRQAPRHIFLLAEKARLQEAQEGLRLELVKGELHIIDWRQESYTFVKFEEGTFRLELGQLLEQRTRFLPATDHLSWFELEHLISDATRPTRLRLLAEIARQRRLAFPVSAPLFCWLGVLLAISRPRAGRWPSVWLAASLVASYYVIMRLCDTLAEKAPAIAGLTAWIPVMTLVAIACWLQTRTGTPK